MSLEVSLPHPHSLAKQLKAPSFCVYFILLPQIKCKSIFTVTKIRERCRVFIIYCRLFDTQQCLPSTLYSSKIFARYIQY